MATKEAQTKLDTSGTEKALAEEKKLREQEEKEIEVTATKNNVTVGNKTYMKGDTVVVRVKEARVLKAQGVALDIPDLPEIKDDEPDPLPLEEREKQEREIAARDAKPV